MTMQSSSTSGFTLVELSIVLVIIGLLVGGIMAGTYLVDAAANQAVIEEVGKYKTAASLFNEKYSGWPGDITNATTLWPSASPAATNGNGNGRIEITESSPGWQQLALAQMIPGNYNGSTTPVSKKNKDYYGMEYSNSGAWASSLSGNMLIYYLSGTTPTSGNYQGGLTQVDAASIDGKIDDGLPATGTTRAVVNATCFTNNTYNQSTNTASCALLVKMSN